MKKIYFETLTDEKKKAGFQEQNMRPLVSAKINGREIKLLIDTCADRSFLFCEWIKNNDIVLPLKEEDERINGHSEKVGTCCVDFEIEQVFKTDCQLYVRRKPSRGCFDGCLGMDLLKDLCFTLDLIDRKQSYLGKPDMGPIDDRSAVVDLNFTNPEDPEVPYVKLRLPDETCKLLPFDTGCQISCISRCLYSDIEEDTEKERRPIYDTLNQKRVAPIAKEMQILLHDHIVQNHFTPYIGEKDSDIVGIDAFNGFIIQHFGQYMFRIVGKKDYIIL